jgi:hypothetical protein
MQPQKEQLTKTTFIAVGISALLLILVIFSHNLSFRKSGTIVLPAGGTYLGPSSTPTTMTTPAPVAGTSIHGRIYPYSFEIPASVKLVTFPNDVYDIYAISLPNQPAEQNVLIGVDDVTRSDALKSYVNGSKRSYVEHWWKQFGGLKGVESITEFTNTSGLKGYKAKYMGGSSTDIFFETPDNRYVIHLANGPLSQAIFDAIVDSVSWETQ